MESYMADGGTLLLMDSLTRAGQEILYGFLRICEMQRPTSPSERTQLHGIHFLRDDVREMRIERRPNDPGRRIRAMTRFRNGSEWHGGRFRVPNVVIPDTLGTMMTGRTLGDLVAEAPFPEMTIKGCSNLKGGTLSIRCGVGHGIVPYSPPPHPDGRGRDTCPWSRS